MAVDREAGCIGRALVLLMLTVPLSTVSLPGAASAQAASATEAEDAAKDEAVQFLMRFDEGDLGLLYDEELAPIFKALMARDYFLQLGNTMRIQSGGKAVAREYVGAQNFTQTPTGQTGTFCWIRHRARHPNGLVFEDVTVQKLEGRWKVVGFNTIAAPQQ